MSKNFIDKQTIIEEIGKDGDIVYIPEQQKQLVFDGYSDNKFLHVYNVPRKLSNSLRWIFYKKYDRFLNENML